MLPGCCKNGIVISKIPVMQAGLKEVMRTHFPEYEIISSASAEDLTLLQLRRSGLVIADLAGESEDPRSVCEHYYSLISQYREIHWVFMVSRSWYSSSRDRSLIALRRRYCLMLNPLRIWSRPYVPAIRTQSVSAPC